MLLPQTVALCANNKYQYHEAWNRALAFLSQSLSPGWERDHQSFFFHSLSVSAHGNRDRRHG